MKRWGARNCGTSEKYHFEICLSFPFGVEGVELVVVVAGETKLLFNEDVGGSTRGERDILISLSFLAEEGQTGRCEGVCDV